jgi:hypothetical protein
MKHFWTIIKILEFIANYVFKVMLCFTPGMFFIEIGHHLFGQILMLCGALRIMYMGFQRDSIKQIYDFYKFEVFEKENEVKYEKEFKNKKS